MQVMGKDVPEQWLAVLRKIQTVYPEAAIVGGCLRDLVLGGKPKDIDVFVRYDGSDNQFRSEAASWGWRSRVHLRSDYLSNTRDEVTVVQEFDVPGLDHRLNLIHLEMPEFSLWNVIGRCDFGCCQLGTDGHSVLMTTAAFGDLKRRRFTLMQCETPAQISRSIRRWRRMFGRYGNTIKLDLTRVPPMTSGSQWGAPA